jgi:hypothetical protein
MPRSVTYYLYNCKLFMCDMSMVPPASYDGMTTK